MLTSLDETTTGSGTSKSRTSKLYSSYLEKKLMIDNLRLAVDYYGKDYLRKVFKIRKRTILHNYMRH
jgi:hypothetical protein